MTLYLRIRVTKFSKFGLILIVIERSSNAIRVIFNIITNFCQNLDLFTGNWPFSFESQFSTADISKTREDRTKVNLANESPRSFTPSLAFKYLMTNGLVSFGGHSRIFFSSGNRFFTNNFDFLQKLQKGTEFHL